MSKGTISFAGRQAYLQALEKHYPEMLESLKSDVRPVYEPEWKQVKDGIRIGIQESWERLQKNDDRKQLRAALTKWADRFSVEGDWMLDAALDTLFNGDPGHLMTTARFGDRRWFWYYRPRGYHPKFAPTFDKPVWYPPSHGWPETWEAFKKRIKEQLGGQLADYKSIVEVSFGVGREASILQDAEWTARYQRGETAVQIADSLGYGGSEDPDQMIFRAISRFASSIGITLRRRGTRRSVHRK